MKAIIGIVVLGVVVGGLFVLNDVTRDEHGKSLLNVAPEVEIEVEVAEPQRREIVRTVQAPGDVEAFNEVDISSEIVSKIVELPVEEGDYVEQGDLLCRLDDADYAARVKSAEAQVARLKAAIVQAQAGVDKALLDYDQERRLIELGATSKETVAQFRTVLIGARADHQMRGHELVSAEATLQSAREDLQRTVITAPISGIVAQLFAEQGEVVITGTMNNPGTRIMVITDLSKMQVRCRVDEADAPLVQRGQPARIYLQSDTRRSITGHVLRVGTKGTKPLGRDVVTFETLVLITGADERVKPGMTANVEIEVAREADALVIPVESVVYRRRRDLPDKLVQAYDAQQAELGVDAEDAAATAKYIRVIFCVEDLKAYPRLITTGINDATGVQVAEGLADAETVVVGPYRSLDQLKDGAPVKIQDKPKSATPTTQPTSDETGEAAEPETSSEDEA